MRRLLALGLLVVLASCGGGGTEPSSVALEGTYSLRTVNGSPLPYALVTTPFSLTLTADAMTLNGNGSWSHSSTYSRTQSGVTTTPTEVESGTWTRNGSAVTFLTGTSTSPYYTGTYADGALTVAVTSGLSYRYTR